MTTRRIDAGLEFRSDAPVPGADLEWPGADRMFGADIPLTWSRRARYAVRCLLHASSTTRLLEALERDSLALRLFHRRPGAFYPVMTRLLDRRHGAAQRCEATLSSLRVVRSRLGDDLAMQSLVDRGMTLFEFAGGTRVQLGLNGASFHEGLWQLAMVASDGARIYSVGFGFLADDAILVGSVQGPSLGTTGAAHLRHVTAAAHGLRPPEFLMHVLRSLARACGARELLGIDPDHHVKTRWQSRRRRLQFDYRAFWADLGADRDERGHWSLPLAEMDVEGPVPQRHGADWRRHVLLGTLDAQVGQAFTASRVMP